jgi:2-oxoglutarate dehydrogenase E1 component
MGLENETFTAEHEAGPSWARPNWSPLANDDLTAALDPTQMAVEIKKAAAKTGAPVAEGDLVKAASDSIKAMMLIRTYRVRGHLTPEYHGFTEADLDRRIYLGGALGLEWASIRELVGTLRANYCGNVGLEYMHIADVEERRFLQERMEGKDAAISFSPEGKKAILAKVIEAEQWERFLGKKYVGTKRFGLDGGDGRARDRVWHGAPWSPEHARERDGQALSRDLPRVFGRVGEPR